MVKVFWSVCAEMLFRLIRKYYGIGNPLGKYKQYGLYSGQVAFPNEYDRPWWLVKWACPKGIEPIEHNHKRDFVIDPFTFNACRVYRFRLVVDGQIYNNMNEPVGST